MFSIKNDLLYKSKWCIFTPNLFFISMARQSITLTEPNDEWLKALVQSKEYASKSEVVNDLIRQAREQHKEVDWIRAKLVRAEQRVRTEGFVNKSAEELLTDIKAKAVRDGEL